MKPRTTRAARKLPTVASSCCDPGAAEELAALAKALAHPARVQIVMLLAAADQCICGDIVETMPLAQSTVSQHLKVLKEAGLVIAQEDGPRVCYCLNLPTVERLKALIAEL